MIIESGYGNYDYYGNLVIEDYPNLQSIVVKSWSLQNLNSLKICKCKSLKTIRIKDGVKQNDGSFSNVLNVIIESKQYKAYLHEYLPNLQKLKTGNNSFKKTTSLFLSSNPNSLI